MFLLLDVVIVKIILLLAKHWGSLIKSNDNIFLNMIHITLTVNHFKIIDVRTIE